MDKKINMYVFTKKSEGCKLYRCNHPLDPVEYDCEYDVEFNCEDCIFGPYGEGKDPRKTKR